MALIFTLIMVGQLKTFAGTNGLTDFQTVFGRNKYDPDTNTFLYFVAAGVLLVVFLVGRHLVRSRYGRLLVAVRDREDRVRFLGYNPAVVKTFAFVVAAGMAGRPARIAAPIIGIVAPNQFGDAAVDPDGVLGRRRRPRHALRGDHRRHPRQLGRARRSASSGPTRGSTCRACCSSSCVAFIPGGIVGLFKLDRRSACRSRRDADPVAVGDPATDRPTRREAAT